MFSQNQMLRGCRLRLLGHSALLIQAVSLGRLAESILQLIVYEAIAQGLQELMADDRGPCLQRLLLFCWPRFDCSSPGGLFYGKEHEHSIQEIRVSLSRLWQKYITA